ncbi:TBC1 domain family member 23 [Porphyridium purpureum]|uniref:TBC1 domain family member 23 n=1 Tax=Porphyridium purpureum TaxID=35688 RepID=A0A5J4Z0E4_PORPP|nr:TBC1 domain family member 23 [Porphyridium purpureum]|eukprot:POR0324..scf208_2
MNVQDHEFVPEPTDLELLRKVKTRLLSIVVPGDLVQLRNLLVTTADGTCPHELRGTLWLHLLGITPEHVLAEEDPQQFALEARHAVRDDNSKEQIWKDVRRTRPSLMRFKEERVQNALLRLLSLFCERNSIEYIQGMNEILAPFVLLDDTGGNPRLVYALYNEFITKFATFLLEGSEQRMFNTLRIAFSFFARLFLYHDPELFWYLENQGMSVDLYTTSWFITIFARNFSLEILLKLWDLLVLEDHALGIYFFGLALVLDKKEHLKRVDPSALPEALMNLAPQDVSEVKRLWRKGSELRIRQTPSSYLRILLSRFSSHQRRGSRESVDQRKHAVHDAALEEMRHSSCLQVSLDETVLDRSFNMSFFLWDCRTREEFDSGHIAQAAYLPLDRLRASAPDKDLDLDHVLQICEPLKGSIHFCLVGSGYPELDALDAHALAFFLTQRKVPFVSVLRGGFKSIVYRVEEEDAVFQDMIGLSEFNLARYEAALKKRRTAFALSRANATEDQSDMHVPASASLDYDMQMVSSSSTRKESSSPKGSVKKSGRELKEDEEQKNAVGADGRPATSTASSTSWFRRTIFGQNTGGGGGGGCGRGGMLSPAGENNKTLVGPGSASPHQKQGQNLEPCKWKAHADAGWLDKSTISRPVNGIPEGFTVNIADPKVMQGVSLFPCYAAYQLTSLDNCDANHVGGDEEDDSSRLPPSISTDSFGTTRSNKLRRLFVGISKLYFLVLVPHESRPELLVLEVIRHLTDVHQVSFKKSKPEWLRFVLRTRYVFFKSEKTSKPNARGQSSNSGEELQMICHMASNVPACLQVLQQYMDQPSPEL